MQLYPDHVWELTTEHGTRIILDLTEGNRWMRIPALGDDGRLNLAPDGRDGTWRRLMSVAALVDGEVRFWEAVPGHSIRIFTGFKEWWTTTQVQSLRRLLPAEVPRPVGKELP